MKGLLLILFLFLVAGANAQVISGKVIDKDTRLPMAYIVVASNSGTAFTDDKGMFTLRITGNFDTIRINTMGYKPFKMPVSRWGSFMRVVEMEVKYTQLGEVSIKAKRNYFKDSVSLRQEYAKQFNFRGPKFNEIVRMPSAAMPFAGITIDVGNLFRAINKKHSRDYRLQQVLLRDERESHVSARFTKTLVNSITALQGDSLENFISSCRPSAVALDKLNDYDLIQYIKTNLVKFRLNGGRKDELPRMLKEGESLE
nr:carboxypeptidase-like regulatory domain-containing protein [uncultured Mucilaginibacter sp.]